MEEVVVGTHFYTLYRNPVEDVLGKPQTSSETFSTLT
jgi:hypothetical protein